ncbi:TetR/AcrR family transcriptional regulator [Nocardia asteroides]|uniref:TetR/AcrR family transcriptional regulator n=1 Tax=Nocardia asteroides TaxID=1824 RepID=UPI00344670A6
MAAGRPRQFDLEDVMARAETLFWARGYEGATMAALSAATGLKPGSIYAAFGSKAELFEQVVEHYQRKVTTAYVADAVDSDSLQALTKRWLTGVAHFATGSATPPGCLLVHSALVTGVDGDPAQAVVRARRRAAEQMLIDRIEELSDTLPPGIAPELVVRYIATMAEGIAVEAALGVPRAQLLDLVEMVCARLPWS